ncbi:hypothetical protein Trydic_g8575 [Trypoxylus dichotomus]
MYRPTSKKLKFLKWFVKMFVVSPLEKCTALFKVYAIAGLVVIVWSFYYEISGRLLVEFHYDIEVSRAGIILDTLNTILEMLYNILITITVILFSNRTKENLLREIDELDCIIAKYEPNLRYQENSLLRIMIVVHVFDFSIFVNDIVLILLTQNEYYIAYCYIDQFYRYRIGLFVLYTYCFIKELLQKISIVNETLVKTFENLSPEDLLQQSPEALNQLDAVVQDISRCYAKFCLIVADVNSIFGWLLLSLFINYLCLFLVSFDIALRIKSNVETVGEAQLYFWIAFLMFYALVGIGSIIFALITACTNYRHSSK